MHDPISDLFIRIKNAQARRKSSIVIPFSKVKEAISQVLLDNNYIANLKKIDQAPFPTLEIGLSYTDSKPAISMLKRISKSGGRVYRSADKFPRPLSGHGLVIVSTPKGIMSGYSAQKQNIGGEIIATIW